MKKANLLSRAEMRRVVGGVEFPASCVALCPGQTPASVSCSGDGCVSVDGLGCNATGPGNTEDKKDCKKKAEE